MRKRLVVSITITILGLTSSLLAQTSGLGDRLGARPPKISEGDAARPVPRLPDGTVDLTGPWLSATTTDIERDAGLKPGELPLLPWAKTLRDSRKKAQEDPWLYCLPTGALRNIPEPWKFAMSYTSKGLTHIYILHETGDAGAHRVVHMDGSKHPVDFLPSWFGHSIGWFDKDTLVIDTVGFNDKSWFDQRGTPHTEQLHTIERFTRINYGTLVNEATLDDPGAFSRPVNLKFTAVGLCPDIDLMEYICLEDNQYGVTNPRVQQ